MQQSGDAVWSVEPHGLCISIGGIEQAVISPAQFPVLIIAMVRELKNISKRGREGR